MAAENIKSVKEIVKVSIGARWLVIGEVVTLSKYKTEGMELTEAQLKEIGLPDAIVDYGFVLSGGLAAKNVEQPILQFNIENPGLTKAEPQKVKIQAYESITTAENKELASESEKVKEAKIIVALIGR